MASRDADTNMTGITNSRVCLSFQQALFSGGPVATTGGVVQISGGGDMMPIGSPQKCERDGGIVEVTAVERSPPGEPCFRKSMTHNGRSHLPPIVLSPEDPFKRKSASARRWSIESIHETSSPLSSSPQASENKLRGPKRFSLSRIRSLGRRNSGAEVKQVSQAIDTFSGVTRDIELGKCEPSISVLGNRPHWEDEQRFRLVEARRMKINIAKQLKNNEDQTIRAEHSLFLSHSWRDPETQAKKRQLIAALSADSVDDETGRVEPGWTYWADYLNLQAEGPVPWRKEIEEGIRDCAKFVAFIDTEYLLSFNCLQEVQFAIEYRKPIVPVILDQGAWDILTSVDGARTAWSRKPKSGEGLHSYNGKFMTDSTEFSFEVLTKLVVQLSSINFCPCRSLDFVNLGESGVMKLLRQYTEKDLSYLKEYSELHKKAVVWAAKGKPHDQGSLLVGEEIEQWTSWLRLAHHYNLHPQPAELQTEYVRVSSKRSSRQRKQRRIGFLILITLILLGACASIALAVIAESSRADLQVLFKKEERLNADLKQLNEDLDKQAFLLEQSNAELEAKGREVQESLEREKEANKLLLEQIDRNRVITRERMIATLFLLVKGQSPESPSELRAAVQACGMARTLKQTTQVMPLLYPILDHVTRKRAWKMGEFFGHQAPVMFVAESPDGRHVATGSQDGAVGVWNFSHPAALPSVTLLKGKHPDDPEDPGISAISWSPDSRFLLSAAYTDPVAWVWPLHEHEHERSTGSSAEDDGDGDGGSGRHAVWGEPVPLVGHSQGISSAAFSPFLASATTTTRIATGSFDFTVRVWSVEGAELDVLHGHNASLVCLEWSPDGERLVSGSDDDALIVLWDLRPGAPQKRTLMYGHAGWVNSVAWRPDGMWLASGSDDMTVALWFVPSDGSSPPGMARQLFGHESYVNDVAWSQDGLSLASASYDFTVRVWHFASGAAEDESTTSTRGVGRGPRPISQEGDGRGAAQIGGGLVVAQQQVLTGHQGFVFNVAWAPDGRLSSASQDGTARVWETKSDNPWRIQVSSTVLGGHGELVWATAWSRDFKHLYSVAHDKSITRWDTEPGASSPVLEIEGNPQGIAEAAAYSPHSSDLVAVQDDTAVLVWNVSGHHPTMQARLATHSSSVSTIAWSPVRENLLASGDRSNYTVVVWDLARAAGEQLLVSLQTDSGQIGGVDSLKWSPDGAYLAWSSVFDGVEGARDVVVWATPNGEEGQPPSTSVLRLRGHTRGMSQIVWSPDSARLAAVSLDKIIYVWAPSLSSSASGDQPIFSIDTQHDPDPSKLVWDIDWSPDGSLLMTASWDGTITIFHLASPDSGVYSRQVIEAHSGSPVWHAKFGPIDADGTVRAASASQDGAVWVHRLSTGHERNGTTSSAQVGQHQELVESLAWSPSGEWLATGSFDGTIQVWYMTTPRLLLMEPNPPESSTEFLAMEPDIPGNSAEQSLMLDTLEASRDIEEGEFPFSTGIAASRSDTRAVTLIQWSNDEQRIMATTRHNPQLRVYDIGFCTLERKIQGLTAGEFSEQDLRDMNLKWLATDIFASEQVLEGTALEEDAVC